MDGRGRVSVTRTNTSASYHLRSSASTRSVILPLGVARIITLKDMSVLNHTIPPYVYQRSVSSTRLHWLGTLIVLGGGNHASDIVHIIQQWRTRHYLNGNPSRQWRLIVLQITMAARHSAFSPRTAIPRLSSSRPLRL